MARSIRGGIRGLAWGKGEMHGGDRMMVLYKADIWRRLAVGSELGAVRMDVVRIEAE